MPSPLTSPPQPTPVPVWARTFSPSIRIVPPGAVAGEVGAAEARPAEGHVRGALPRGLGRA